MGELKQQFAIGTIDLTNIHANSTMGCQASTATLSARTPVTLEPAPALAPAETGNSSEDQPFDFNAYLERKNAFERKAYLELEPGKDVRESFEQFHENYRIRKSGRANPGMPPHGRVKGELK